MIIKYSGQHNYALFVDLDCDFGAYGPGCLLSCRGCREDCNRVSGDCNHNTDGDICNAGWSGEKCNTGMYYV